MAHLIYDENGKLIENVHLEAGRVVGGAPPPPTQSWVSEPVKDENGKVTGTTLRLENEDEIREYDEKVAEATIGREQQELPQDFTGNHRVTPADLAAMQAVGRPQDTTGYQMNDAVREQVAANPPKLEPMSDEPGASIATEEQKTTALDEPGSAPTRRRRGGRREPAETPSE